jgi:hypothetical protein
MRGSVISCFKNDMKIVEMLVVWLVFCLSHSGCVRWPLSAIPGSTNCYAPEGKPNCQARASSREIKSLIIQSSVFLQLGVMSASVRM